jgi:uncharacterized protein (DUF2062 family)
MSYFKKIWQKLIILFKQGLSPRDLALSIIISILVAIFPVFGITTIALTCIALPLRLNLPIMIAISYIATPLQLLLFIPFINFGASVVGAEHTLLSLEAIKASYELSVFSTLKSLSFELLCGFIGWLVLSIPISIVTFYLLQKVLSFFIKQKTFNEYN